MHGPLTDPRLPAFFEELHRPSGRHAEDWSPMVRLAHHLRSQAYSGSLAYCTVHHRLFISTGQPVLTRGQGVLQISWSPGRHLFSLVYSSNQEPRLRVPVRECEERTVVAALEAQIQRLLMESPLPP